jgi:3-hydroxyisobutyrate dehydrogenase-like beta-hydroxyacid dehydrogenase
MNRPNTPRFCFIGFGEAGQAMAGGLRETGVSSIVAWDILFPVDGGRALRQAGEAIGVRLANSAREAVAGTDVVVSAVTAASSLEAAQSVQPYLTGQYFLDINSVSPGRKKATAELFGATARYLDVAVMAPIHPARHRTPMLLAGPHAQEAQPILQTLAMNVAVTNADIGSAAAIKMVRGVIIKGIEALTAECFIAAARAGIASEVMDSLKNNYPTLDWAKIVDYNLERMTTHGERRAAEMEEVAATLRELGVEPLMTSATVVRQRELGRLGKEQIIESARTNCSAILSAIAGSETVLKNREHK